MSAYVSCDVLVIGGGLAAIKSAITAAGADCKVIIACKGKLGFNGSSFYAKSLPWGILTSGYEQGSNEEFLEEVVKASMGCLHKGLTKVLVDNSNEALQYMLDLGIEFEKLADRKHIPCFGKKSRGSQLLDLFNLREKLFAEIKKHNIKIVENVCIADVVVQNHQCIGAMGVDKDGKQININAKSTIIATGGAESLFKHHLSASDLFGDGYAMALRNGCELVNMEFIQFIPGTCNHVQHVNFHQTSLATLPQVLDSNGATFLEKYLPSDLSVEECLTTRATHGPFSNEGKSRYFDIAIYKHAATKDEGATIVYNNSIHEPRYKEWLDYLNKLGIDYINEPLKIFPHAQGFNGGIAIDKECHTSVQGLFACGEASGGPHGANRMGGNAILGTQVLGKIAGEQSSRYAKSVMGKTEVTGSLFDRFNKGVHSTMSPLAVIEEIQQCMDDSASIVRHEVALNKALDAIQNIEKRFNPAEFLGTKQAKWAIAANNAILISKAIIISMLNRKESRGSHYREDYPNKQEGMEKIIQQVTLDNKRNIVITQIEV